MFVDFPDDKCFVCGVPLMGIGTQELSRFSFLDDDVFLNVGINMHICGMCKSQREMQRSFITLADYPPHYAAVSSSR